MSIYIRSMTQGLKEDPFHNYWNENYRTLVRRVIKGISTTISETGRLIYDKHLICCFSYWFCKNLLDQLKNLNNLFRTYVTYDTETLFELKTVCRGHLERC